MSSIFDSAGRLGPGAFAARFALIAVVWAALVAGVLHYVGHAWPIAMQQQQFRVEEQDRLLKEAVEKSQAPATPKPAAPGAAGAATAGAATTAGGAAPAANGTAAVPAAATTVPTSVSVMTTAPASTAPSTAATGMTANATAATSTGGLAANATAAANPAEAPKPGAPPKLPPPDFRLSGLDRQAFGNVSVFMAIVISILTMGTLLNNVVRRLRDLAWPGISCLLLGLLIIGMALHMVLRPASGTTVWWLQAVTLGISGLYLVALMVTPGRAAPATAHGSGH